MRLSTNYVMPWAIVVPLPLNFIDLPRFLGYVCKIRII